MRPVYETEAHLQGEQDVAKKLEAWINNPLATVVKTPPLAPYDYCIVKKGLISGVVEIKVRSNPSDKYPTYMISLEKVSQCTSHANIIGCPFYVVVQWTDKLGWWKFDRDQYTTGIGGRTDRNDSMDQETVIYIPINNFTFSRGLNRS